MKKREAKKGAKAGHAEKREHASFREQRKSEKSYRFILFLIIIILAVTLVVVAVLPMRASRDSMALYLKPVNCGISCNDNAVDNLVRIAGKRMISYEAEFVKSPFLLVAEEGVMNLVPAQNMESLRADLCTLCGGKVCK